MTKAITCPSCKAKARTSQTKFGRRDDCEPCGLWSWDGKPLVSPEIHNARKACHEVVDRIWKMAPSAYTITEPVGSPERAEAERRIRRSMRNRVYHYIAAQTGMPEPECHMAEQQDIVKLRMIWRAAKDATPETVRAWAKTQAEEKEPA